MQIAKTVQFTFFIGWTTSKQNITWCWQIHHREQINLAWVYINQSTVWADDVAAIVHTKRRAIY